MSPLPDAPFANPQSAQPTEPDLPDAPFIAVAKADSEPPANEPHYSTGIWNAFVAGEQASGPGLATRGKMPDVVLDPTHAPWYEKLISGATTMGMELPEMVTGAAIGGLAGTIGGATGEKIGAGFGAFALPAAIRQSYIDGIESGKINSSADFLTNTKILLSGLTDKQALTYAAKQGTIGAVSMMGGIGAAMGAKALGASAAMTGAAETAGQIGGFAITPAALEGKLPEPEDFANAAIMVVGMKTAGMVAGKIANIWQKTGIPPEQVVADAKTDPSIKEDLLKEAEQPKPTFEAGTPERTELDKGSEEYASRMATERYAKQMQAKRAEAGLPEPSVEFNQGKPIEDIPEAYKGAMTAAAVREIVPDPMTDPEHALNVVDMLKQPTADVPLEKTPNFINYQYMDTPDAVKGADARISEIYEKQLDAARGTSNWEQNKEDAAKLMTEWAKQTGEPLRIPTDPREFNQLAAKVMANKAMTEKAAYNIHDVSQKILAEGETPDNVRALGIAMTQARLIKATRLGNEADIARAMNAMKSIKQVKSLTDQYLEMHDQFGGDPTTLANMIDSLGTADRIGRFANEMPVLNNWQKLQQYYRFALLSGATVYQVKGVGDLLMTGNRVLQQYIASGLKGDISEPNAMLNSMLQGTKDAVKAGVDVWRASNGIRSEGNMFGYTPAFGINEGKLPEAGSAADIANRVMALPHRIIAAETEIFRVINERGEMGRLAHNQAISEGIKANTGDYAARITQIMQNPTESMIESAKLAGEEGTFTKKLGQLGEILQTVSKSDLGGFVVPFAKVPANITNEAVKEMPVLGLLMKESRDAWKLGGNERNKVIARQIIGSTVATIAAGAVKGGIITGGSDWMTPQQKQARLDAGIPDYSFKIGNTWHSYQRYQPFGTIAQVSADLMDIYQHSTADERADIPKLLYTVISHAVISQSYFEGLHQFMSAAESEQSGARYFDGFIGAFVPSFLGQTAGSIDPNKRRIDSLMDELQSKIPLLREKLLPQLNPQTGEPLANVSGLTLSHAMTESKDPVLAEAARLGVGVSKAPKKIEMPAMGDKELGAVQLTPEQQNLFDSASGKMAHDIMTQIVSSSSWADTPDIVKKQIYSKVMAQTRKFGASEAFPGNSRAVQAQIIADEIEQRMKK